MNITEHIKKKRFAPGKGVTEPPPKQGVKRFFFLLLNYPWKLVTANLLFLVFCLPVLTVPAAFCGLNRVLIKLVREGNCFIWSEFWKEFKANLLKGMLFGLICASILFASYYFLSLSVSYGQNGIEVITGAIGFSLLGFAVLFSSYVFVFLPTLALNNKSIAKNAFIMLATEWKTNLIIIGSLLSTVLLTIAFFPYTVFIMVFILFSFYQLVVCTAINEPLQRRIIGPYEEGKRQAS